MTTEARAPDLARVAFVDLEASSLSSSSYPTEIGWAVVHEDGAITSGSCLIRPPAKWTMYANAWSAASERLTGITREMLDRDGLPPGEALTRFLDAVGDRDLFSDAPDFDTHWLGMLAEAAGISLGSRLMRDTKALRGVAGAMQGLNDQPCPDRHRAEPDARRLAVAFARGAREGE